MDPIIVDEDLEMEVRHKSESITSIVATLRDPRIRATVAIPENGPTASFGTGTPWVHNRKRKRSLSAAPDSIPQHSQNKRRTALHKKEGVEGHNISATSSACSDHVSMGGELNNAHEEDPVMAREMEALKARMTSAEYETKIQALQAQRVKKQQTRQLAGSNTGRNAESGQGVE
ncbi:hypothetical protein BDP27DRAFT_1431999 [Rhodocollybia butyracea]|uniref:Uncharacterized protein n=1 Tax=Rhodocollybia butyracea TaxID=206335 RepID=A0A9P5P7X9_9AGAR|nr:hypothetical protein BDP27DRAFT_1431999 [Rhodocollybia butyracea]